MFQNGYDEEIARRSYGNEGRGALKTASDLALALSVVVFGALFWFYVAIPVWSFGNEIVDMTEKNQRGIEELRPLVGRCFDNGVGAVGLAISVADGAHLKIAFASGFSQTYPAAVLKPAECPSK